MKIDCLGASQEVGRSAFLLETDKKILLDYGIKIFGKDEKPEYPLDPGISPDVALISHAHMDHIGYLPYLYTYSNARWYATQPTRELAEILLEDSMKIMGDECPYHLNDYRKAMNSWSRVNYGEEIRIGNTTAKYYDAGHISGSSMIDIEYEKKRILYTGDFKMEPTRLHRGAKPVEDVDVLIIESTYALKEHPKRREAEEKLMNEIEETFDNGGTTLLPAFALGRSQELMRVIRGYNKDIPVFLDGMGKKITEIYMKNKGFIEDPMGFKKDARTIKMVYGRYAKMEAVENPGVIITSAGMMQGGPVLGYLLTVNKNSKVIFTGYNVQGTNGWKMLNKGYVTLNENDLEVDLPAEYIDMSAHGDRNDILNFIKYANPEKIILVHSDCSVEFGKELIEDFGYDAIAPKLGDQIKL